MPLYAYACRSRGCRFEALVRGSAPPSCPRCQGVDLERMVSLFAVDSDSTRKASLAQGRKRVAREQRDKTIAGYEDYIHHHE